MLNGQEAKALHYSEREMQLHSKQDSPKTILACLSSHSFESLFNITGRP
jgi:hypothetical protein